MYVSIFIIYQAGKWKIIILSVWINNEGKRRNKYMKRVTMNEYKILRTIFKNVLVVSASDNEALIFLKK